MYCGGIYEALDLAAELGHSDMIPLLIAAGYEVAGTGAKSPLHTAALNGHASVITQLLDHGAPIHTRDKQDRTVLRCAIEAPSIIWNKIAPTGISEKDDLELVLVIEAQVVAAIEVLLRRGAQAQVRMADRKGDTPLHHAAYRCLYSALDLRAGTEILHLLVQAGASLTARNNDHKTPYELVLVYPTHCATSVNFFLDIGLSPNAKDCDGHSPLLHSVLYDESALQVMEVLLRRGANAEEIQLWGFFHDSACQGPGLFDKILNLLLIHGATFGATLGDESASECFTYAAMFGMLAVMKVVLETCPAIDINTSVREGRRERTPLQLAIGSQRADIVEYLVEHGVKMSKKEEKEVTKMLG